MWDVWIDWTAEQKAALNDAFKHLDRSDAAQALVRREQEALRAFEGGEYALTCAWSEIEAAWPDQPHMHAMVALLGLLPELERFYRQKRIDKEILRDTLRDFPIWMERCKRQTGAYGMKESCWLANHVTGKLFKLGRLQFMLARKAVPAMIYENGEGRVMPLCPNGARYGYDGRPIAAQADGWTAHLDDNGREIIGHGIDARGLALAQENLMPHRGWRRVFAPNDLAIEVHIPEGEPLDECSVRASLERAPAFFEQHFQQSPPLLVCESWLMDSALATLAPESRIAAFQKRFVLIAADLSDRQMRERVFDDADPLAVTPETGLQRAIQRFYRDGGSCHEGYGLIFARNLAEGM